MERESGQGRVGLGTGVTEVGSSPSTHPLRSDYIGPVTDPVLRGVEELAITAVRVEILSQPE